MRFSMLILALLISTLHAATPDSEPPVTDPDSMQALMDAQRAREAMPGKQHYQRVCVACHDGTVPKAPHKDMIGLMTPESVLATITSGIMQQEAQGLSETQKIEVSEYLAGQALGQSVADIPACEDTVAFDALAPTPVTSWGLQANNNRHVSITAGGLTTAQIKRLQPSWALGFPGANRARSQPAIAGGLMFVGSHNGRVYALDDETGCQVWSYQAAGEVRTGIVVDDEAPRIYFGDVLANAYALDARTGDLIWRIRADDHPSATITGTPSLHKGSVYIPVSALEVSRAIDPGYPCCTSRGSVLAVDASSGETRFKTYTIQETPRAQGKNASGTTTYGPSGAVIWNSPAVDAKRQQIYVGTGENASSPATTTSDAIFAIDMGDGKVNWTFQATPGDAWNVACDSATPDNCPEEQGPDFDFGAATMLVTTSKHGDLVIAGQKSGLVHALDPATGKLVWQTRVGRGGIQGGVHFGMAAAGDRIFVPISDMADGRTYPDPDRPGMHALNANTGAIVWSTLHEDHCDGRAFCHPGISQVPTVVGDVVLAGAMDGIVRAYATATGEIVWELDTTQAFPTTTGTATRGGSFGGAAGPIAYDGKLVLSSGYGIYNHMPGNLLLVLTPR